MAYVTVYSPDGQKFEVASRDRADSLILEKGWTQTMPEPDKQDTPKRKSSKKKKEEKSFFEPDPWKSEETPAVATDEDQS